MRWYLCNVLSERGRGAWSLVCDTEEQWVNLAESVKDKISPQDRHLHRIITQNFLPEIRNMIEHKVNNLLGLIAPHVMQSWVKPGYRW